ncbi:hypothetical protein TRIP_B330300 [uncultured Desulfatiglans sp.]|uniref:Uncharacterized protein n=1 Tax=Uncultured Desulfatiglans sp. TaxID=1748965 RepID=A0A653A842_UNCDX|nr:hypothetical protein TRIP_B330300 [uncultured Desulfatiglans sp.]
MISASKKGMTAFHLPISDDLSMDC